MSKKRKMLPKMEPYLGYRKPEYYSTNDRTGVSFYRCYCEGEHEEWILPEKIALSGPPFFWSKKDDHCGCSKKLELTPYYDVCKECGNHIYLTPGRALVRKSQGEDYVPKIEYCFECLDRIVESGPCRNKGCQSVGGIGIVEATFGDKLSYEKKGLSFPPKNCVVCRRVKKELEKRKEIRRICKLCNKPFRITFGVMIMTLKNDEKFEVPSECMRCRGLSPDERGKIEAQMELDIEKKKRYNEVARIFSGDIGAKREEYENLRVSQDDKKREFLRILTDRSKIKPKNMRELLHSALSEKTLHSLLSLSPNDAAYRELQEAIAHSLGGKAEMTDKEFIALPIALLKIITDHPDVLGLFKQTTTERAPGMSAVSHRYEILSAAALMNENFKTNTGNTLSIYSTDKVSFGQKYAGDFSQPIRYGTGEADIKVCRGIPGFSDKDIGIEAKYSKDQSYSWKTETPRQMEKICHSLMDGQLQEYYIITNGIFENKFTAAVDKANLILVIDYLEKHDYNKLDYDKANEQGKEHIVLPYKDIPIDRIPLNNVEHITSYQDLLNELSKPDTKVSIADFDKYHSFLSDIKATYADIPQIEICENVKFPNT